MHADRWADRQAYKHVGRQADTGIQACRQTGGKTDRHTSMQTDKQTGRQRQAGCQRLADRPLQRWKSVRPDYRKYLSPEILYIPYK